MKIKHDQPIELAKEMFYLAWNACGSPSGMGFLQDNPTASKEDVWKSVSGQTLTDYCIPTGDTLYPRGDYVFGRMMIFGTNRVGKRALMERVKKKIIRENKYTYSNKKIDSYVLREKICMNAIRDAEAKQAIFHIIPIVRQVFTKKIDMPGQVGAF